MFNSDRYSEGRKNNLLKISNTINTLIALISTYSYQNFLDDSTIKIHLKEKDVLLTKHRWLFGSERGCTSTQWWAGRIDSHPRLMGAGCCHQNIFSQSVRANVARLQHCQWHHFDSKCGPWFSTIFLAWQKFDRHLRQKIWRDEFFF